jgi:hypothetical protein
MKEVFRWGIATGLLSILLTLVACQDPCQGLTDDEIGGEYFTITYLDAAGRNLLEEVWRQPNVEVFIDSSGSRGQDPDFYRLRNAFANGKFGPFFYTEAYTDVGTREVNVDPFAGQEQRFDYYIKKDTFGVDTFTLRYVLEVDACRSFWSLIEYSYNGDLLGQYTGQRQAEIVITE